MDNFAKQLLFISSLHLRGGAPSTLTNEALTIIAFGFQDCNKAGFLMFFCDIQALEWRFLYSDKYSILCGEVR